ncbi:MAG: ATP-binding cassette domain-containing protein [Deltaproteobacteria bacterium]|nr:ATP-binding cassette domain-containing protein [Deltaproteobacteria bacterium]
MISVENLTKRYGQTLAVDSISFEVNPREVVGFLGPNGAGKTTTMKMLTCFLRPDEGRATVGGYDVVDQSMEVRRRIGYLPENAPLYYEMDVRDYLVFMAKVRDIPASERKNRVREMAEVCGLGPMMLKPIGELSKGYRQRVGLAQAMLHRPDILILDEPTSGLDPNQIIEIRNLIKEIGREKTVILSTHILPEVQATCSRVLIISNGRIAGQGTTEELARMAVGEERFVVAVRGPRDQVKQALAKMDGCTGVTDQGVDPQVRDFQIFRLFLKGVPEGGEKVFQTVASNGWTLSELRKEVVSLEDVFKRLTRQTGTPGERPS